MRNAFVENICVLAEISRRLLEHQHFTALTSLSITAEKQALGVHDRMFQPSAQSTNLLVVKGYKKKREVLLQYITKWVRDLVMSEANSDKTSDRASDGNRCQKIIPLNNTSFGKRTLLTRIMELCSFYGPEASVDHLLPELLTFLNDRV